MPDNKQKIIDVLTNARDTVNALLPDTEDQHHRLRIESSLNKIIDRYGLMTGTAVDVQTIQRRGPATTIAGKPIERSKPVRTVDVSPKQAQIDELKTKIEGLYTTIETIDTKELVSKYDEMVIRGVARKVHMKVTKDDPKKITIEFVNQIKKEVIADKERVAGSAAVEDAKKDFE